MKTTLLVLTLFASCALRAQTTYYTFGKQERFTELELFERLAEETAKFNRKGNQVAFVSAKVHKIVPQQDSLIAYASFFVTNAKPESLITLGPMADQIGQPFPAFSLAQTSGNTVTSPDLVGKPTLINVWFTKCAPCIEEMPALNRIAAQFGDRVNFLSITFSSPKQVERFLEKHEFNFTHLVEGKGYLESLGIEDYPMNLFLDKEGRLAAVEMGIPYEKNADGKVVMGNGKDFVDMLTGLLVE